MNIVKTGKKGIINIAFHQGMVFKRQAYNQKNESLYIHSFSFEYALILVCRNFWVVCLLKISLLFMEIRLRFYFLKLSLWRKYDASLYHRHISKSMKVFICIHFRLNMYLFSCVQIENLSPYIQIQINNP